MKKRALILVAAVIGLALLVYGFRVASETPRSRGTSLLEGSTQPPQPPPRQAVPSEAKFLVASKDSTLKTPEDSETDLADNRCWERLDDQIRTNRYIETIRPRLNRFVGPWFHDESNTDVSANETSIQGRFFQALAEGGLLEGRTLSPNYDHALKLLREVAAEDRSNSAPILFAAVLADSQGDTPTASRLFEEAKRRRSFNAYVLDFNREVFRDMKTPEDWIESINVTSRTPMPRYPVLVSFLRNRDSASIAKAMISNFPADESEPLFDLDWLAIEYVIGLGTLQALDPAAASKHMPFKELLHRSAAQANARPGFDFFQHPSKYGCDAKAIEPTLELMKEHLAAQK